MMAGNSSDKLVRIGEQFGSQIAELVRTSRALSVTVMRVDENNAYVRIYENDEPLPVPLSTLNLANGMFRLTPNVGSLAIVGFANGDDNAPYFVAFEQLDKIEIKRGKTSLVWKITPPKRDENGDEPSGSDTKDEFTLSLDTSSVRITKDLIEFNGGTLDGLVSINALTDRLNKLQSELNTLVSTYNGHTHPYTWAAAAGASVTSATTATGTPPSRFSKDEYENKKIAQ